MANKFVARKGLISLDDTEITGSLSITENIIAAGTIQAAFAGSTSTAISGAFTDVSSSLSGRITSNEVSVSSLNSNTSSYALKTDITGSFTDVSASITSERLKNTTDTLDGDLTVTGTITAQEFHTELVSASIIYESGSTQFGNSSDDTHSFTGTLTNTGNVGIGTTSPFDSKLQVVGRIRAAGGTSGGYFFGSEEFDGGFYAPSDGNLAFSTNGTERIRIDGNGNVGIGTTSPLHLLHVNGASDGNSIYTAMLQNTGTAPNTASKLLFVQGGSTIRGAVIGGLQEATAGSPTSMVFETSAAYATPTEKMRITSDGNVGIGTTSPTSAKLVVAGDLDVWSSTNTLLRSAHNGSFGSLQTYTGGAYGILTLNPGGGNVGIGTTSPSKKLDVDGAIRTRNSFNVSDGTTQIGGLFPYKVITGAGTDNSLALFTENGLDLHFMTDGSISSKMIIKSGGNVGIGTTSPGAKLDVEDSGADLIDLTRTSVGTYRLAISGNDRFSIYDVGESSERLSITSTGNVGIGTTSPDTPLHIDYEQSSLAGNSWIGLHVDRSYASTAGFYTGLALTAYQNKGALIGADGNQNLMFFNYDGVNNVTTSEAMRLNANGVLNIYKGSSSNDNIRFYNTDGNYAYIRTTSANNLNNVWFDGTLGCIQWYAWDNPGGARTADTYTTHYFGIGRGTDYESVRIERGVITGKENSNTDRYKINPVGDSYFNGGNVGIGTSSPDANLEISKNAGADPGPVDEPVTLRLTDAGNAANGLGDTTNPWAEIQFYSEDASSGGPSIQAKIATIYDDIYSAGSHIVFYNTSTPTNGLSERMRINSVGNVSIGTAAVASANAAADNFVIKGEGTAVGLTISNSVNSGTGTIFFGDAASSTVAGFRYNHNTGDMAVAFEDDITFSSSGYEKARILSSGGITFNGDTSTSNALDDYEEGTFTPVIGDGTYTYSNRRGHYVKIGNLVYVHIGLRLASASPGSSTANISGLPFTSANFGSYQEPHTRVGMAGLCVTANLSYNLSFYIASNNSVIYARTSASNVDSPVASNQLWKAGTFIKYQLIYTVS